MPDHRPTMLQRWRRHRADRRPDPPPAQVDLFRLLLIGIGVWTLALVVCAVLWWRGHPGAAGGAATCAAGIALGLIGLVWVRTRKV